MVTTLLEPSSPRLQKRNPGRVSDRVLERESECQVDRRSSECGWAPTIYISGKVVRSSRSIGPRRCGLRTTAY